MKQKFRIFKKKFFSPEKKRVCIQLFSFSACYIQLSTLFRKFKSKKGSKVAKKLFKDLPVSEILIYWHQSRTNFFESRKFAASLLLLYSCRLKFISLYLFFKFKSTFLPKTLFRKFNFLYLVIFLLENFVQGKKMLKNISGALDIVTFSFLSTIFQKCDFNRLL